MGRGIPIKVWTECRDGAPGRDHAEPTRETHPAGERTGRWLCQRWLGASPLTLRRLAQSGPMVCRWQTQDGTTSAISQRPQCTPLLWASAVGDRFDSPEPSRPTAPAACGPISVGWCRVIQQGVWFERGRCLSGFRRHRCRWQPLRPRRGGGSGSCSPPEEGAIQTVSEPVWPHAVVSQ